jgi:hypothetical protein
LAKFLPTACRKFCSVAIFAFLQRT